MKHLARYCQHCQHSKKCKQQLYKIAYFHSLILDLITLGASQVVLVVKNPFANTSRYKRHGFDSRGRKILWRRAWQPTPVFLPGESHGQRSQEDYSPWGCKESDKTEVTARIVTLPFLVIL